MLKNILRYAQDDKTKKHVMSIDREKSCTPLYVNLPGVEDFSFAPPSVLYMLYRNDIFKAISFPRGLCKRHGATQIKKACNVERGRPAYHPSMLRVKQGSHFFTLPSLRRSRRESGRAKRRPGEFDGAFTSGHPKFYKRRNLPELHRN